MVDPSGKFLYMICRDHAVHHKLRITGNGHQRGLQLMRNICGKFLSDFLCLLQFFYLLPDLPVLFIHPHEKGTQLLITHIVQRMFQIQIIDRPDQFSGLSLCKNKLQDQYQEHQKSQHCKTRDPCGIYRIYGFSHPEHISVIQLHRIIKGLFCKGFRITDTFAFPFFFRLDKFRTITVICQFFRRCIRIIENGSVFTDQGHTT